MSTVQLRKTRAGSDSWGHSWPEDGAVVEVDYEQAMVLLAIPDGGFSVTDTPQPEPEPDQEPTGGDAPEEPGEVSEPDAGPDVKPAPRRGGRPRKTVEEG